MSRRQLEIRSYILSFLKQNGASTTARVIQNAPLGGDDCIDKTKARVVALLLALEEQKLVKKAISKQMKALVWLPVE